MSIDIDIIVYAVIAALLLWRLWAVLGTRNDSDPQLPNPFTPPPPTDATHTVVGTASAPSRLQPFTLPPNSLAGGLAQVKAAYAAFDEKAFLQEARDIFTTIVSAYAAGRLNGVAEFLAPELMHHFQQAIDARTAAGQTAQTRVVSIKETEVTAARAEDTKVFVTVKIISNQENILRDKTGTIIGGGIGLVEEVTDSWAFSRAVQEVNTQWVVVETGV